MFSHRQASNKDRLRTLNFPEKINSKREIGIYFQSSVRFDSVLNNLDLWSFNSFFFFLWDSLLWLGRNELDTFLYREISIPSEKNEGDGFKYSLEY